LIGNTGLGGPLVIVAKAGRAPYDVIVARKGLDAHIASAIRTALLRLSIHDAKGRSALRAFSSVDGFMPVPTGHYDAVRALAKKAPKLTQPTPPK
jgi:ABC-type phosphate/phosphonate transport system substrate-binding protein